MDSKINNLNGWMNIEGMSELARKIVANSPARKVAESTSKSITQDPGPKIKQLATLDGKVNSKN